MTAVLEPLRKTKTRSSSLLLPSQVKGQAEDEDRAGNRLYLGTDDGYHQACKSSVRARTSPKR